jgi:hypothetical protein
VDGTFDPVVEDPTEEANEKQVAQRQQEVDGFSSKLRNVQIAEKLK